MSNIQRAAKEAGVDQVMCPHCGAKFSTKELLEKFFIGVLELLRRGERVRIAGFGFFKTQLWKGREHKTPIIPGGVLKFDDTWVVRFKLAGRARDYINNKLKPEDIDQPEAADADTETA